ncbi:hypothetical protein BC939DRAFT_49528 [Gamsiella multidivaricata]|uniref:uncharacterized protein n=1 Tax=Gamsiella multidivaricata TaxID=101098 RepID=UPI00221F2044|nr:uncharacterized protein BC939DRAFT_49528 [Gamsiella multidivaricata]KAI7828745.1 hypothetical protein BC939DRAFT_49528 [Gamsiella multidivaricata]
MQHGIMLIPTLSVGIDVMGVGVVLVSIMGLLGVAKGCRHLMNLYFALVLCFIAVQVGNAIIGFMSGSSWIQEALQKSWDKAYHTDRSLIRDLQTEFHCQGFLTREDRAATMSLDPEIYLPPCAQFLYMRFGKRLQRLGSIIFCIRLIQLTGVFLLSILFKHLATMDPTDEDEQERTDGESPFFKSEKQIEDEIARAPLLAGEDDDLPHYSVGDYYGSEEYDVESDEDEDGSGGSCDEDDEHQQYRGRFFYGCFGARDYEYRDLPDYAEDKRETQPL